MMVERRPFHETVKEEISCLEETGQDQKVLDP